MIEPSDYTVIKTMQTYGGHFVRALAVAALYADAENLSRIKSTWPEYWERYKQMAQLDCAEKN